MWTQSGNKNKSCCWGIMRWNRKWDESSSPCHPSPQPQAWGEGQKEILRSGRWLSTVVVSLLFFCIPLLCATNRTKYRRCCWGNGQTVAVYCSMVSTGQSIIPGVKQPEEELTLNLHKEVKVDSVKHTTPDMSGSRMKGSFGLLEGGTELVWLGESCTEFYRIFSYHRL